LAVWQAMFTRKCCTSVGKVALAQGAKQIAGQGEAVTAPLGKTLAFQIIEFDFAAKAWTERQRLRCNQLLVEPGGSAAALLASKIAVGMCQERGLLAAAPVSPGAELDNCTRGSITGHVDVGEFAMMDPAIHAVDYGIGLTGQLIVQATLD